MLRVVREQPGVGFGFRRRGGRRGGGAGRAVHARRVGIARPGFVLPDVPLNGLIRQRPGGAEVKLGGQVFHPLPRHEQRRRDDQNHRRPKKNLALRRQRDAKLANPLEQLRAILSANPAAQVVRWKSPTDCPLWVWNP